MYELPMKQPADNKKLPWYFSFGAIAVAIAFSFMYASYKANHQSHPFGVGSIVTYSGHGYICPSLISMRDEENRGNAYNVAYGLGCSSERYGYQIGKHGGGVATKIVNIIYGKNHSYIELTCNLWTTFSGISTNLKGRLGSNWRNVVIRYCGTTKQN
jgi:hypothetical protein